MKKLLITAFAFALTNLIQPQTDPKNYLAKVPSLPNQPCSLTLDQKDNYLEKVNLLSKELQNEIDYRKETVEKNYEESADDMKKNMMKNSGLSDEDIQKIQDKGDLTEDEKRELANKMLKQKANLTMNDVDKLKNMSDAERKAWGTNYGKDQMKKIQSNPESMKVEQEKNKKSFELAQEQKLLLDKISANDNKFSSQLKELNEIEISEAAKFDQAKQPLIAELRTINDGEGATEADSKHRAEVLKKLHALEENYCNQMTPKYYEILQNRWSSIESLLPDYRRLEEVNAELNKTTTGITNSLSSPGFMEIGAIEGYVSLLKSVFKYCEYSYTQQ